MQEVGVQFREVGKIFYYQKPKNMELKQKDKVVVDTDRGVELGEVVSFRDNEGECENKNQIKSLATKNDLLSYEKNEERAKKEYKQIQQLIYSCGLDNKLCDVEFLLDNKKLVVTFASEERVDFRYLVKRLTERYKMKIEICLVGSRDEVKYKGALGPCGRECCCATNLRNFDKITIKMAKNQNLSLTPSKISGACGKLKCCLSYENETYVELSKTMPKLNSVVKTPKGEGLVIYNDLFKQRCVVKINMGDNRFENFEFEVKELEFSK